MWNRLFFLFFSCLFACSSPVKEVRVGIDPYWYPLALGQRAVNVTAFATELLKEIGTLENIPFVKITSNSDELLDGLKRGEFVGILGSLSPQLFNEKIYAFSESFLPLGPVLVVPINSPITSLEMVAGKKIGITTGPGGAVILDKNRGALVSPYETVPQALNDVVNQTLDGALVDILTASAYCKDLYAGKLHIVTPPLTDEGLRLILPYGTDAELIEEFNTGLNKLKARGIYEKLLKKWDLVY
ncbi:MAG: transporter substrate-binding domain-containing protein [Verrucomicrobia bacterium]|nr:transporter substrate-binding domain-containing protein [Verrucomicrobiota bacterium]